MAASHSHSHSHRDDTLTMADTTSDIVAAPQPMLTVSATAGSVSKAAPTTHAAASGSTGGNSAESSYGAGDMPTASRSFAAAAGDAAAHGTHNYATDSYIQNHGHSQSQSHSHGHGSYNHDGRATSVDTTAGVAAAGGGADVTTAAATQGTYI